MPLKKPRIQGLSLPTVNALKLMANSSVPRRTFNPSVVKVLLAKGLAVPLMSVNQFSTRNPHKQVQCLCLTTFGRTKLQEILDEQKQL